MSRVESGNFREWNERMIRRYDPDAFHHHPNPIIRFIESRRVKAIFELMDFDKEDRLLEVGCGAGNVLEKADDGKLFGVDISTFALAKAKQKVKRTVFLMQGDAERLPCKKAVFSRIICSEVLEHLLEPAVSLKEMARVLDDRGVAIISVPNEFLINRIKKVLVRLGLFRWLLTRSGGYPEMPERMEDEWHLHTFRLEEWVDLFEGIFRMARLKKVPFFWLPLRYVMRLEKVE